MLQKGKMYKREMHSFRQKVAFGTDETKTKGSMRSPVKSIREEAPPLSSLWFS